LVDHCQAVVESGDQTAIQDAVVVESGDQTAMRVAAAGLCAQLAQERDVVAVQTVQLVLHQLVDRLRSREMCHESMSREMMQQEVLQVLAMSQVLARETCHLHGQLPQQALHVLAHLQHEVQEYSLLPVRALVLQRQEQALQPALAALQQLQPERRLQSLPQRRFHLSSFSIQLFSLPAFSLLQLLASQLSLLRLS
jgi:hypothetical protein